MRRGTGRKEKRKTAQPAQAATPGRPKHARRRLTETVAVAPLRLALPMLQTSALSNRNPHVKAEANAQWSRCIPWLVVNGQRTTVRFEPRPGFVARAHD